MRIAILSDIHGNFIALETVLADVKQERIDQIVCLGDVAYGGPQPHQVIARVRELSCSVVMGNTDEFFVNLPTPDPNSESDRRIMDTLRWALEQLSPADTDFARTFQARVESPLNDRNRLLCFHGSPNSNRDVILATTPDQELAQMLGDYRATIMAGGHTHMQMLRRYRDMLLINPGSIGLPIVRGETHAQNWRPPRSEYAIITSNKDSLGVEFRRVSLDVDAIVRSIRASGMPHSELLVQEWAKRQGDKSFSYNERSIIRNKILFKEI